MMSNRQGIWAVPFGLVFLAFQVFETWRKEDLVRPDSFHRADCDHDP